MSYERNIILSRISSRSQEPESLDEQKKRCLEYAKTLLKEESKRVAHNNPKFEKLLDYCGDKKNDISLEVCEKLGRLIRFTDGCYLIDALKEQKKKAMSSREMLIKAVEIAQAKYIENLVTSY